MTLELVSAYASAPPGYAGVLQAARYPALAARFHFWRGSSGRRYACTMFPAGAVPAYENAVMLFVHRRGGEPQALGVAAGPLVRKAPFGTEEIHLHLALDGESVTAVEKDLRTLAAPRPPAVQQLRIAA